MDFSLKTLKGVFFFFFTIRELSPMHQQSSLLNPAKTDVKVAAQSFWGHFPASAGAGVQGTGS